MTEFNRPIDERGENKYLNKWVFPRGMKREGATATTAFVEVPQPCGLGEAQPCRPRAQSPVNRWAGLSHSSRKIEDAGSRDGQWRWRFPLSRAKHLMACICLI